MKTPEAGLRALLRDADKLLARERLRTRDVDRFLRRVPRIFVDPSTILPGLPVFLQSDDFFVSIRVNQGVENLGGSVSIGLETSETPCSPGSVETLCIQRFGEQGFDLYHRPLVGESALFPENEDHGIEYKVGLGNRAARRIVEVVAEAALGFFYERIPY